MTPEHTALVARLIGPVAADVEAALRSLSATVSEKEGAIERFQRERSMGASDYYGEVWNELYWKLNDAQDNIYNGAYEAADAIIKERDSLRASVATLTAKVEAMRKALREVDGCFEAALVEGWTDALANGDLEAIRDLYNRRIAFARDAAVAGIGSEP